MFGLLKLLTTRSSLTTDKVIRYSGISNTTNTQCWLCMPSHCNNKSQIDLEYKPSLNYQGTRMNRSHVASCKRFMTVSTTIIYGTMKSFMALWHYFSMKTWMSQYQTRVIKQLNPRHQLCTSPGHDRLARHNKKWWIHCPHYHNCPPNTFAISFKPNIFSFSFTFFISASNPSSKFF